LVDWRNAIDRKWDSLRFGDLQVKTDAGRHTFEVAVFLNDLDPNAVRVELFADGINGAGPVPVEMKCARPLAGGCVYTASVPASRPAEDYTARVIAQHSGVSVPLECDRVLWQR
jgi:starch phosphorylase